MLLLGGDGSLAFGDNPGQLGPLSSLAHINTLAFRVLGSLEFPPFSCWSLLQLLRWVFLSITEKWIYWSNAMLCGTLCQRIEHSVSIR